MLVYVCVFVFSGVLVWKSKNLIWPYVQTTFQMKLAVFLCVCSLATLTSWLFRDKAKQWAGIVIQRITPLAWLFGIFVFLAIPLVGYYTLIDGPNIIKSQNITPNISMDKSRPNIILVTFDALAAHNMSAYGYSKETTPFISKWAKNATVFTMAEAASNFTTPAAASLMTGKRVWTHQTYHVDGTRPVRGDIESLPALLKEHGYFNMALVVNPFASVKVLGMADSFDIAPLSSEFGKPVSLFGWKFGIFDRMLYEAFGGKIRLHNWILKNDFILSKVINLISRNISQTTVPPKKTFDKFLEIIDSKVPEPFFAWIHVFPPHDPYLPPEPYKGDFNTSLELRTYKSQEELIEKSYEYLFQYRRYPEEIQSSVSLMRDYYDEFVKYIDKEFEAFIVELNIRKMENTILMLSADHGESFEHGYFTHGGPFLYEQVTHVPLIIKEPGQKKGQIIDLLVEQIDIPATVLDLANILVPSWMEGRSLVPLLQGEKLPARPAFSMNFEGNRSRGHEITKGSIAIWEGKYKLIHYLGKREPLLFNLKQDPNEIRNLFDEVPEVSEHLLQTLLNNLESANERIESVNLDFKTNIVN